MERTKRLRKKGTRAKNLSKRTRTDSTPPRRERLVRSLPAAGLYIFRFIYRIYAPKPESDLGTREVRC